MQLTRAGGEMSDMFALSLGQTGPKPSLDLLAKKKGPYSGVPLLDGCVAQPHPVGCAITRRLGTCCTNFLFSHFHL